MDKTVVESQIKKAAADADKFVRENPWAAVGAAVLIGYLLGSMRKKNGAAK
jgi:ElaB/YqjD/DUF883 family membrane-anchored ribosome-binding protein